ncbi:helix-turn-helix domain-containing protein [Brevundimonas diminuta ATCC 11568]|uniref:helix-turn-helix domain-containing protein n=1 Tax=Brevundimonas diminuta TaxID=293 RepID=UPI000627E9A5|nr:AraC family transcriptional regulator [Brevundimonas diminuta]
MSAYGLIAAPRAGSRLSDLALYGGLFATAVAAFCLAQVMGHRFGMASEAVAVLGDATCGWSWLLVRALFQPPLPAGRARAGWPLLVVLALVGAGAFLRLAPDVSAAGPRMVDNLSGLVSSALLLLAAVEPLKRLGSGVSASERGFRISFAVGYAAILAVAVVWVNGAPDGSWAALRSGEIKAVCALIALGGMGFAVWWRRRRPLTTAVRSRARPRTDAEADLGERILRLMTEQALYAQPSLKVSDLAQRLGEAEYKVSRSIAGLGFRNFSQMANHFRIEEAKRRLADPALRRLPILTIAYDCGFGSIGPFNRAFKAQTGVTPQAFRARV